MKKTTAVAIFLIVTLTTAYFLYVLFDGLDSFSGLSALKAVVGFITSLLPLLIAMCWILAWTLLCENLFEWERIPSSISFVLSLALAFVTFFTISHRPYLSTGILALACGAVAAAGVAYLVVESGRYVSNAIGHMIAVSSSVIFLRFSRYTMHWRIPKLTLFCLLIIWGVIIYGMTNDCSEHLYSAKRSIIPISFLNAATLVIVRCLLNEDYNLSSFIELYVTFGFPIVLILMIFDGLVIEKYISNSRFID